MPRTAPANESRSCLVVGPGSAMDSIRSGLSTAGFRLVEAPSEKAAIRALDRFPVAAAFVDGQLGTMPVSSIIASAGHRTPGIPVLVVSASANAQDAVDAMQKGAADYLVAPLAPDAVLDRLYRVLEHNGRGMPTSPFVGLVGSSSAMRHVYELIWKISRYKTNVLLLGESGTGKELIARALHARGPRRQHLFVPLNCATLGRDIIENELFGHERGAFTGASELKRGLFELADGGTLFLDEISAMDPSTQAKLLRVLERNEFRRVGGMAKVKVDLSVIAATNRKLEDAIAAGKFRDDLYYRLKVVTLAVPPLRERKEDIPELIDAFIADFNRRNDGKIRGIAPRALKRLMEYNWPGNVRELRNAVESAAVLTSGETIDFGAFADALPPRRRTGPPHARWCAPIAADPDGVRVQLGASLEAVEEQLILAYLDRYGTKARAAKALGIGLRTLYTKLREYSRSGRARAETA